MLTAGVFDGHGIQGRSAATSATEGMLKHLQADARSEAGSISHDWQRIFADACIQVCVCEESLLSAQRPLHSVRRLASAGCSAHLR